MSNDEYWKARNQGQNGNARPVGGGPGAWQGYDQGKKERENQQQSSYTPSPHSHIQNNNTYNNPTYIQNDNTGSFSPSYSSGGGGEGCITVFFPIISYIIVFSTLFNFGIDTISTLSMAYDYKTPEWLPSISILIFTCIVLYYRKYIGRMALLCIVILVGVNLYGENVNKQTKSHQNLVTSKNTPTKKQRAINIIKESLKDTRTTATSTMPYNFNQTKEEMVKAQCNSCIRMLKVVKDPESKKHVQKNCNTITSECRKYQIIW